MDEHDERWERFMAEAEADPTPRTDKERARVARLLADHRFNQSMQGEKRMTGKTSTENMPPREAMRWFLEQPEGTEFEIQVETVGWLPVNNASLHDVAQAFENGNAFRIAPRPAAPERVWIAPGEDYRFLDGEPRPDDAQPYVPEAMVTKGRSVFMARVSIDQWHECDREHSAARRVLILDDNGDSHE